MIAAASGAHKVTKEQQPELYRALENVGIAAGLAQDARPVHDRRPRAQRVRRRARPGARLRRRHHRPGQADGQARAGGRAGARGVAHPKPRRAADEPGRGAGGRDRAGLRPADADHDLRRRSDEREGGLGAIGVDRRHRGARSWPRSAPRSCRCRCRAAASTWPTPVGRRDHRRRRGPGAGAGRAARRHPAAAHGHAGDGAPLHRVAAARPQGAALQPGRACSTPTRRWRTGSRRLEEMGGFTLPASASQPATAQ